MNFESQPGMIRRQWELLKCPFCGSMFKLDYQELKSSDHYSFSCLSCEKLFWAAMDENQCVQSFKHPLPSTPQKQKDPSGDYEKICDQCLSTIKKGSVECSYCGKSFYDSKWRQKAPPSSHSVRKSFENLLNFYNSDEKHRQFVSLCLKENCIPFALHCYKSLSASRPKDSKALAMVKYLENLSKDYSRLFNFKKKPPQTSSQSYLMGWAHGMLFILALVFVISFFYF